MNNSNNIEQGLLEMYAIVALPAEDAKKVEALLASNPNAQKQLEEIETALESYAQAQGIKPNKRIKDNVFKAIHSPEINKERAISNSKEDKRMPLYKSSMFWFSVAASILFLIAVGGNFYQYNRNVTLKTKLVAAKTLLETKEAEYVKVYNAHNQLENKLAMLIQPKMRIVKMNGTKDKSMFATVIWDELSKKVMLSAGKVKPLADNQIYQLWAMVDGNPVDLGIFTDDMKMHELKTMKSISQAEAFAVTIEPEGGSKTPTMQALVLLGSNS